MSENELLFSLFFVSCRSKNKVEQPMIKDFDLLQRAISVPLKWDELNN